MAAPPAASSGPAPELIRGKIKKVNSADTFVLQTFGADRAPVDAIVHLANLSARKVAVYTNEMNQRDDSMGWECREILRKELIGTDVVAEIEHKAAKSCFAYVYKGAPGEGESLNETIVARGLASVKDVNKKNERYEKLKELQEQAKNAKVGIWSDSNEAKVREIEWAVDDVTELVSKYKGKELDAIVEGVHPNAAGVRAFVQIDGVHYYLTVMLAGIRGPSEESLLRKRGIYFLESGLMHASDVKLLLDSAGNNGQIFGRVKHPQYDIVKLLLENGLAQTQDWSLAQMEPKYVEELRTAERRAKQSRKGLWKDYKEPAKPATVEKSQSTVKVVEVIAADMLMIKDSSNNLKKIFLSSIRPPRRETAAANVPGKQTMAQKMFQQPLLFQAREFLRKALIGKNVQVQTDFIQPKSDQYPEKVCCTVTVGGKNIAEQLVAKGLASVIRYRQDNDQRSPHYFDLQTAESNAQKEGLGLFAKKDPEPMKVIDLQGEPVKSKQYFSSLQRSNPLEGIVEYVSSGSRLRVYCAKHNCVFPFLLNGIQCPRASRLDQPGTGGDEFGDDALKFTKDHCLQHEINMEVEGQDKNGAMIGKATIGGKNLSVELVKVGLAKVHHYSAEKLSYCKELNEAEELAKEKKLCLWEKYVEEVKEEAKEVIEEAREDHKSERKVEFKEVQISEITPEVTKFYVQYNNDQAKFSDMQAKLQEALKDPAIPGTFKRGERAAAKFSDGLWYRVKIEKLSPKKADLLYIDFGNRGECPPSELQRLPAFCATAPDLAHPVNLAFVKMPKDEDDVQRALNAFGKDVQGGAKMNIEYTVQGELYVSLHVGDSDVGRKLIEGGHAFFEPRRGERYAKMCKEYQEAQDKAKNEHLNLWEYGDAREDEEDRH